MKYTGLLLSLAIFSSVASAEDYVTGSCEFQLSRNDVTKSWGSKLDDPLKEMKTSESIHTEFRIDALSSYVVSQRFERIVPYWRDRNKYQHFQIVSFADDFASKQSVADTGIEFKRLPIKGDVDIRIDYSGMNTVLPKYNAYSIDAKTGSVVTIDVMGIKNGAADTVSMVVTPGDSIEFNMEYEVPFNFKDFGGDGFFGSIFKGDLTNADVNEADMEIHKSKIKGKCIIELPSVSEVRADRNEENTVSIDDGDELATGSDFSEDEGINVNEVIEN